MLFRPLPLLVVFLSATAAAAAWPTLTSAAQVGASCSGAGGDCGTGLHCDSCGGTRPSICTRVSPFNPESHGTGLPFNRYTWLTTHNSYALSGAPSLTGLPIISPTNQEDNITSQLQNGVRGLMLDTYDFLGDVWLCHSFGGVCYNFTAFQPAINVLMEVEAFLASNPSEVVILILEDYTAIGSLPRIFNESGLTKYWFPVSQMPQAGGNWPLLKDMISQNQRLLVFTSKSAKEATEGIPYEWTYLVENQYGDGGMVSGSCPNRAESSAMNDTTRSLVLMNYFPDNPNMTTACADNSAPLMDMLDTCYNFSDDRWANFIAVDFYMRSDGGGAALATDVANGHMVCGCNNIAYCVANASYGTCTVPPPPPPSPPPPPRSQQSTNAETGHVVGTGHVSALPRWGWLLGLAIAGFFIPIPVMVKNNSHHMLQS